MLVLTSLGVQFDPLAIHQWWILTSGVVACSRVVPLQDSSEAHRCVQG
jgi:hypothetical protein